ncbi:ATP-binding protein [Elizabethkingia anophelis]|nr:ATP-binding protein [Elizabethkingia anophelis]MCT4274282.1 ATP-binding protein [Elizabethkingia anophelis]MCT4291851.1 ATP-binding protein [Elizabethkingia anophelis]
MNKEKLHFKTNIQLKNIIGKDLINDDNIAILELVKNSFDADAKKVTISFRNLKNNDDQDIDVFSELTSKIIIQDNGIGMTIEDIKDKWLNIAYSEKKENTRRYNRMMAGAKGVGRFSCDRLGEYLNLYTKTKSDNKFIKLQIDWKEFEINDKDLQIDEIILDYTYVTYEEIKHLEVESFSSGVILEIIKLRSKWVPEVLDKNGSFKDWNTDKLTNLKKYYLEKLINPNQAFEENDFGIFIDAPEFVEENKLKDPHNRFLGKVENTIFDKLDFQSTSIESSLIENGKVIYTELKDKGSTIFWIKEKSEYYPLIKNAKITLYYLNPYAKAFFTKQTGIRSVDYGSIFLFINGFRVPPYGDVGNDWLGIDQRKAQGYARYIGLREFVGRIEILDKNNDFQIISSREGIVRNDSYIALVQQENNKSYFFKTLRRLEKYVVDGLDWDSIPTADKDKIGEIEKSIVLGEINEADLKFRESEVQKRRRIYEVIHSIIGAKSDTVIEIYINENLILDKIQEEKELSEREFNKLLNDFEKQKIDSDTLNKILRKKAQQNKELEKEIRNLTRYTTNEITSKAILELEVHKEQIKEQETAIKILKKNLEQALRDQKETQEEVNRVRNEVEETKKELLETKSQNLFLKSVKSQDFDDVVNLMHHIGISTGTIQNYVKGVVFRLDNNIEIPNIELKDVFSKLNYELNKIYSISKFATKANFKVEAKESLLDLTSFIEEYLLNIVKPYIPSTIGLSIYDNNSDEFITRFKPIELTIIIDNLINNSRKGINTKIKEYGNKNYSPKIEIEINNFEFDKLQIKFRDNGIGISKKNQNKIFDYGFTTTDGSGLGLTHIQDILNKMGATIILNKDYSNGAEFIITFIKH